MAVGGGAGPAHVRAAGRSPTWSTPGRRTTRPRKRLGITQSAVSQRAQAAGIVEGRRARELVTDLTGGLLEDGTDGGTA